MNDILNNIGDLIKKYEENNNNYNSLLSSTINEKGYDYQEYREGNVQIEGTQTGSNTENVSNISENNIEIVDANIPVDDNQADYTETDTGYFPKVFYNNIEIELKHISKLNIFIDDIIPSIFIKFTDPIGLMGDTIQPNDDSKIRVFLSSRTKLIKDLYLEFKIFSCNNKSSEITIVGKLNVNGLYTKYNNSIYGTSLNALMRISKTFNMGFNTNISNTDDTMNWLSINYDGIEFINHIAKHGYINDYSHVKLCIDYNYNINYIDLKKELERNTKDDLSVNSSGMIIGSDDDLNNTVNVILSNEPSMGYSNLYFSTYKILNDATKVSINSGYSDNVKMYDTSNKDLLMFNVNSFTSDGSNNIIMKSSDTEFVETNINTRYVGKVNTYNTHRNFQYAPILNERNYNELFKLKMEVIMPTPNLGLYLYQNISVLVKNQQLNTTGELNKRLSKNWIILDISYIYNNGQIKQKMILGTSEMSMYQEEERAVEDYNDEDYGIYDYTNIPEYSVYNAGAIVEESESYISSDIDIEPTNSDNEFDNRVRALLSTIRYCEGTSGPDDYTKIFNVPGTQNTFSKSPDGNYYHPNIRKQVDGYNTTSAGAYQTLYSSWTDVNYNRHMIRLGIKNFNFDNQDKWCMMTLRYKRNVWDDIRNGKLSMVIKKIRNEWSSIPGGVHNNGRITLSKFVETFNKYLENERNNKSILYINKGFSKNI